MKDNRNYESPFSTRYASAEMQYLFSADMKFTTWRALWIALAEAEQREGLDITDAQLEEMRAHEKDVDYAAASAYEKELRHDVMAHIHAWGDQIPGARPIIHLGATSCYVGDNTDMIIMKKALELLRGKLLRVIQNLRNFAMEYREMPALAYTHLQPAQLTTVGKRATLWLYDLLLDLEDLDYVAGGLLLLGSKGTTGTQASFLELFDGDAEKVARAEEYIASKFGFAGCVPVSGQTYTRKHDSRVMSVLSGIAQSAYKFSGDMRIAQSFMEMEEPFEKHQIGSSAMPYKRNPMRSERIAALARYVISDSLNPAITAGTQWFERTLDDSANKRISMAEAFLAVDAILNIYINISENIVVNPMVIRSRVMDNLPYMASENIMMEAVKRGGDRQELHERIRVHSIASAEQVKKFGKRHDLIQRIEDDPLFPLTKEEIEAQLQPENYTGRSADQVCAFVEKIDAILEENRAAMGAGAELTV